MNRHARRIEDLIKLAEDVVPVGAARIAASIVIKNRTISHGINKGKTDPQAVRWAKNPLADCPHAEVIAIKNALKRITVDELAGATLYVARAKRESAGGEFIPGLAMPCNGCRRAINAFNIGRVFYSLDNKGYGQL